MGDKSDPPTRHTLRRKRLLQGLQDTTPRMRDQLPSAPVIVQGVSDETGIDRELRTRCEVILEQVAEINGILSQGTTLPDDYALDCRDRLVDVARSTEEILESVAGGSHPPRSMSSWLLRLKRQGGSTPSTHGNAH